MASADPTVAIPLCDGSIDLQREQVYRGGEVQALTTREAALITYLAARPGEAVTRQTLQSEVWGYHDSVVSRTVDTTIRRLRRKIEAEPSRPIHLITVHGVGYRFEPAPTVWATPAPDLLIGRSEDLADIGSLLRHHRIVTLMGSPGIGKSSLAREAAARWPEDTYSCDLGGVADPLSIASVVAARAGVSLDRPGGRDRIGAILAAHPGLWIFDDADRAVQALGAVLGGWLSAVEGVRVLITSCTRLKIPEEVVFEVGPLSLDDAMALLARRAERAGAQWTDRGLLQAICQGLDRVPLALELAGGRARVLGARDLVARLEHPLRALGESHGQRPIGSLRGALHTATADLGSPILETLAQCAVFPSTFSIDAVEAIVEPPGGQDVLDAVAVLRDGSLLQARRGDFGLRLWLLRPVRAFALERLADRDRVVDRLRRWLLQAAEAWVASLDGADAVQSRSKLAIERLALVACLDGASPVQAARLTIALDALLALQGPAEARLDNLDAALGHSELPDPLRADLLRRRGEAHRVLGRLDAAVADLEAAEALGGDGPQVHLAWVFVHLVRGDRASAEARLPRIVPKTPSDRIRRAIASALIHRRYGRLPEAEADLLRALEWVRAGSVVRFEGAVLSNLANLRRAAGQTREAEALIGRAVQAHRGLGQIAQEAGALHNLAGLLAEGDDLPRALRRAQGAVRAATRAGDATVVAHAQHLVAHLLHRLGQLDAAEIAYVEAIGRLRALDPVFAASALGDLAALQADVGRLALSRRTFDEVRAGLVGGPDRLLRIVEVQLAHLDLASGDREGAIARRRAADPAVCRMPLCLLDRVLAQRVPTS